MLRWNKGELQILKGQAGYSGTVRRDEAVLTVSEGKADINWTEKGLKAGWRGEYVWRFRYDATKRIRIETMMGGESGGDIFLDRV